MMIVASLLYALEGVIFKFVAVGENFWISNFWEGVGFSLLGIAVFAGNTICRKEFIHSLKAHRAKIAGATFFSELLTTGGNLALNYAFLLAPVVLVRTIEGYQPIFVLFIGLILTKFFPHILTEKMHARHLAPKIAAIITIFIGSYFILV